MGMSTHIVGFREQDSVWEKHLRVWNACLQAGVKIPEETSKFFDWEDPNNSPGAEVKLGDAVAKYNAFNRDGYEIDITKLPKDIKIIRFYNSY